RTADTAERKLAAGLIVRLETIVAENVQTLSPAEFAKASCYQYSVALALGHINLLDNPNLTDEERTAERLACDWGSRFVAEENLRDDPPTPMAQWILISGLAAPDIAHIAFFPCPPGDHALHRAL